MFSVLKNDFKTVTSHYWSAVMSVIEAYVVQSTPIAVLTTQPSSRRVEAKPTLVTRIDKTDDSSEMPVEGINRQLDYWHMKVV